MTYIKNHNRRIICKRNPQIRYKERKCVYAILYDNDGNIAITNDGKYHKYQRVILKEYIEKCNKGKEV